MRPLTVLALALPVGIALGAGGVLVAERVRSGELRFELPDDMHLELPRLVGRKPRPSRTIYLSRHGAVLTGGKDDAARGVSSVVGESGRERVSVPAYRGSTRSWQAIVRCVRDKFAPFDVEVTDVRPTAGGYVHVVVGGTPAVLGYERTVSGLAPFSGEPVENPVVFVFSRTLGERTRAICETTAMEVAHAYGLDHIYLCKDPMTYLQGCGSKQFQDVWAPCGEKKPRACADGQPTQNSYAKLAHVLGVRRTASAGR